MPLPDKSSASDTEAAVNRLWALFSSAELLDEDLVPLDGSCEPLRKLDAGLRDLRALVGALSRGDLEKRVSGRGYILSTLKALQSHLRHLTWQTRQIAGGDFTQRVDFLGEFSVSFNEMTEKLQAYSERLEEMANIDSLTRLPNRNFLVPFLAKAFAKFRRDREIFSVVLFDIDRFKKINDQYGHASGDFALVKVAKILGSGVRSSDVLGRYGGEEFLAVLVNTGADAARLVAERARLAVEAAAFSLPEDPGDGLKATVSAGVSQVSAGDTDFDAVVRRSDEALYAAKRNGRNRVEIG